MENTSGDYWRIQVTHEGQEAVDIVSIEDDAMDTAKGDVEDEACESSMIVVTNTTVHPWTMVVHLLTTPGQEGEEKEGEEKEEEEEKSTRSRTRRRQLRRGRAGEEEKGGRKKRKKRRKRRRKGRKKREKKEGEGRE